MHIVELKIDEAKAVVGGAQAALMQRGPGGCRSDRKVPRRPSPPVSEDGSVSPSNLFANGTLGSASNGKKIEIDQTEAVGGGGTSGRPDRSASLTAGVHRSNAIAIRYIRVAFQTPANPI
jgi:hypothetical protein